MAKCANSTTASQFERRATLRTIMLTAWGFSRSEPGRAFSDCLRGAWRWIKRLDKATDKFLQRARKAGGVVRLSPDLHPLPDPPEPVRDALRGPQGLSSRLRDREARSLT